MLKLLFCASKTVLTISTPLTRTVTQRNSSNQATVTVTGTFSGASPNSVQVRAISFGNYPATFTNWQVLDSNPRSGIFKGDITLNAGYYTLQVRPNSSLDASQVASVDRIGIGEVFIVAGQSNSGNWAGNIVSSTWVAAPSTPTNDLVISRSIAGTYAFGADPQPSADGAGGSAWPSFGDDLYNLLGCPVCITAVGIGGTVVHQWSPNVGQYYQTQLLPALQLYPVNGIRAILWFQGESDAFNGTSNASYKGDLRDIITQSRVDIKWQVPWGIGIESFYPTATPTQISDIADAQTEVAGDTNNFIGPSMNSFTDSTYRNRSPDFSPLGMSTQASLWVSALQSYFGF